MSERWWLIGFAMRKIGVCSEQRYYYSHWPPYAFKPDNAQSVRMSYTGTPGFTTPFWVTYEAGVLKKQGLRGEIIMVSGGALNLQALIAGEVDFVNAAGPALINAVLKGADLTIIASAFNFLPYGLVVGKDIRSPGDLKGKRVTLSGFGGLEEFAIRLALDKLEWTQTE